ncbi:MAG: hypothetical protein HYR96_08090 [Deltaproteobacteria bacterium]|nr:hypothetical protein [Deltaproteobacteria bacterium]MBI3293468.1 hypothetical protein [Deltaproteobacteria bacterium]
MRFHRLIQLILAVALLAACQGRRCQAPPEQPFQTFVGTQWRLVSTTDPGPNFSNLSSTNFMIFTFNRDFTGDIKRVENNALSNVPVANILYNVDPSDQRIRMQITQNTAQVPADGSSTPPQTTSSTAAAKTLDFRYSLNNEFELTATNSGFQYRFVPFTGVINPDQQCTF